MFLIDPRLLPLVPFEFAVFGSMKLAGTNREFVFGSPGYGPFHERQRGSQDSCDLCEHLQFVTHMLRFVARIAFRSVVSW